jgi:hypothetical protein
LQADQRSDYLAVLGTTAAVAFCSFVSAVLTNGECQGDGSYIPDGPGATPTDFCTSVVLPGWTHSLSSWAVLVALFVAPSLIALVGGLLSVRTNRPRLRVISRRVAFGLVVVIFVVAFGPLAGNGFKGGV